MPTLEQARKEGKTPHPKNSLLRQRFVAAEAAAKKGEEEAR